MLKKIYRLTKKKDFERVSKKGKTAFSQILLIKYMKNNLASSRFGLIVSNKISKKATLRNLIKRRISEILRLSLDKIKKGYDIMIIVSPKIFDNKGKVLKYSEIEKNLIQTLQKIV